MNTWLHWGIPVIVWLQGLGAWLTIPMKALTFLGTEEFFLLFMPALYWCYDAVLGYRLGLILITSSIANITVKHAFGWPRPYWVSDRVRPISHEPSFGLPSGHAQNALAVWGRLAAAARRSWAPLVATALVLLISLSRLYLGVHFPTDVLAGWLLGGLILAAFLRWEGPVQSWLSRRGLGTQLALALAASLAVLAVNYAVAAATEARPLPQEWIDAEAAASPADAPPLHPDLMEMILPLGGLMLGWGAGGVLLFNWGKFDAAKAGWGRRIARFGLGVVGVAVLYFGLRLLLPSGPGLAAAALRYLRYAAVGFWIAYLAPRLFVRLQLA